MALPFQGEHSKVQIMDAKTLLTRIQINPSLILKSLSVDTLVRLLEIASESYYIGQPDITDDIYDLLRTTLAAKSPGNEALSKVGSPVPSATGAKRELEQSDRSTGAKREQSDRSTGSKVSLPFWMGSLDKIRDDPRAITKWASKNPGPYLIEDKLDGNSALYVIYADGTKCLYSRGDGSQGQDISHLLPTTTGAPGIRGLGRVKPNGSTTVLAPKTPVFCVRGELILSRSDWASGLSAKGTNARNVVAGVLHSKHPDRTTLVATTFVVFEQLEPRPNSVSASLQKLRETGFHVVETTMVSSLEIEFMSSILIDRRKNSPYDVDGMVIIQDKVPSNPTVGKNPDNAFAFKSILTHEEAEVVVSEVEWNASKDGYMKPIIKFVSPVFLAGANIQKATGFNAGYIRDNRIGPGSRVVIIRSGDVIPHIQRVLSISATGNPSMPTSASKWTITGVDLVVDSTEGDNTNDESSTIALKRLEHFVNTLDMKGVGPAIISRMYQGGYTTPVAIAKIEVADLLVLDGFQTTLAKNAVAAIKTGLEKCDTLDLMVASNLFGRGFGHKKLLPLLKARPDIMKGVVPDVIAADGVGPTMCDQFLAALPHFFRMVKEMGVPLRMPAAMVTVIEVKTAAKALPKDSSFVFTGYRNKELETEIERRGGKISSAVTKKTTCVIAKDPEDAKGKISKAIELGVSVWTEDEFRKLYVF